ncbi:hypothetical protein I4U23_028650 [Adineta vaga]|nr:hypothetical protein I4U23_028650 [Adineta vaga]
MDLNIARAPIFKRIDEPWIALLVLGIFIFISSIVALIILCYFWRRHQQRTRLYNESFLLSNKPTGRKQMDDQQLKSYETQKMEVFVSSNDEQNFPATYSTSPDDAQQMHQYYERTTKAYF